MNARTLSAGFAGVALIGLALGCERGNPARSLKEKEAEKKARKESVSP